MIIFLVSALLVSQLLSLGALLWFLRHAQLASEREAVRLQFIYRDFTDGLLSKSVEEKVQADALRANYNFQLERLKDSYAKADFKKAEKKKAEDSEQVWKTADGREISSKDYEIVS